MKKQYKYLIGAVAVLGIAIAGYSLTKTPNKVKTIENTPFGISQKAVFFYPSINSDKPEFYDDITIVIQNTIKATPEDRRIKKASIENIKITKEPKVGGYSLFKPTNDSKLPFSTDPKYNITNAKRFDINVLAENINLNFIPDSIGQYGGIVHLYYYSNSFKPIAAGQTLDFAGAMKQLGITNDSLKSKIAFDVQVTNIKNETFIKHLEFDLPASDIYNTKTYSANSKMIDVDKNMFSKK